MIVIKLIPGHLWLAVTWVIIQMNADHLSNLYNFNIFFLINKNVNCWTKTLEYGLKRELSMGIKMLS